MLFETISLCQGIYIPRTLYCDSSELKARRGGKSMIAIHSRKLSPLVTKPDSENTYKLHGDRAKNNQVQHIIGRISLKT